MATQAPAIFTYPAGMLHLEYSLSNGQMFRWRQTRDGWWDAVTGAQMLRIRQVASDEEGVDRFEFYTFPGDANEEFVRDFFRLDVGLEPVYASWKEADPYLGSLGERFR